MQRPNNEKRTISEIAFSKIGMMNDKMKLWIVETSTGIKRTYETTAARARAKMEKHGLTVKTVRAGGAKDYPENVRL